MSGKASNIQYGNYYVELSFYKTNGDLVLAVSKDLKAYSIPNAIELMERAIIDNEDYKSTQMAFAKVEESRDE